MNLEALLVLIGLLMFGLSVRRRFAGTTSGEENQHLNVFANLGCLFVIIGFGALIIQSLSNID